MESGRPELTTLRDALEAGSHRLTEAGATSPRKNAESLLMYSLGRDRAYLYAHPERTLTGDEEFRFEAAVTRRERGEPLQYVTGHQEFWGLDLLVSPAVLIPRPETEHVVEAVLERARSIPSPRIVDVGTGSGCIALALAQELPHAEIHGVDISSAALEVARANAQRLGFAERVRFQSSDLLGAFSKDTVGFDFVVSNPPYVSEADRESLQPEVRDFEPHAALFAGPMGLDVVRRLIPQAQRSLKSEGWLVMEIGKGQDAAVQEYLSSWKNLRFVPDLQGILRVVVAQRP